MHKKKHYLKLKSAYSISFEWRCHFLTVIFLFISLLFNFEWIYQQKFDTKRIERKYVFVVTKITDSTNNNNKKEFNIFVNDLVTFPFSFTLCFLQKKISIVIESSICKKKIISIDCCCCWETGFCFDEKILYLFIQKIIFPWLNLILVLSKEKYKKKKTIIDARMVCIKKKFPSSIFPTVHFCFCYFHTLFLKILSLYSFYSRNLNFFSLNTKKQNAKCNFSSKFKMIR